MIDLICFTLMIFIILIDFLSKKYAIHNFANKYNYIVLKKVISFTYVKNYGSAFGILQNKTTAVVIVTAVVLIYLLVYFFTKHCIWQHKIFITLIFSGALGNLIDRLQKGYVVDFISLDFINFPVFNVSDIFLCIGMFGFALCDLYNTQQFK
jgi:signal peptidase II